MPSFINRTYDEIQVGETLRLSRHLTPMEVEALAFLSGNADPFHLDRDDVPPGDGDGASAEGTRCGAAIPP